MLVSIYVSTESRNRHDGRTRGEGEAGDSQGSRKASDSATGSPLTQTIVCVSYLAAKRKRGGKREDGTEGVC